MSGSSFSGATGAPLDIAAIFGARNHYSVLGLAPSADAREIRHAYRQVSLRIHPDKVQSLWGGGNPELLKDAEAAFKLVSAAYEILTDVGKRAAYDQSIGLYKKPGSRTQAQQQEPSAKPETWVYRAPKKEEAPPEARESIVLTVTHAIYGHEVKVTVSKGIDASLVKKTLSKMVKRGPPDRIEFSTREGVPIDNDYIFSDQQQVFSVGLSLGPPRTVRVAVTDCRTGVCRSLAVPDTSSMMQVAREAARTAGVTASEVEVGHFLLTEEGINEFEKLDERELLKGRRRLVVRGKTSGLFNVTLEEATAMQDDLIAAYSQEDVQRQLGALIARQRSIEAQAATDFHQALGELAANARKDVVAKWGFEGDFGFVQMCKGIHRYEAVDKIHIRSIEIGKLLRSLSREGSYLPEEASDKSDLDMPTNVTPEGIWQVLWDNVAKPPPPSGEPAQTQVGQAADLAADSRAEGVPKADSLEQADIEGQPPKQVWRIVGGQDKGGILVREGLDMESYFCAERLSHGAFVRELELVYVESIGERLHFERLTGTGPDRGWISVALPHKDLAERMWMSEAEAKQLARVQSGHG